MTRTALARLAHKLMDERTDIPAQKIGKYEIQLTPVARGEEMVVASLRDAMFSGVPVTKIKAAKDMVIRELKEEDGTWMSDRPCELVQMWNELAKPAKGRVLIGGLGLGIVARMCANKKSVKHITVVERQPEVIQMVAPYLTGVVTVVQDDIYEYLKRVEYDQFDCALLDTWQGTGEWTWQTEVVPQRRYLARKIPQVICWHEDVMINQVYSMLMRVAEMPEEALCKRATCHYYAFRCAVVAHGLRPAQARIKMDGSKEEMMQAIQIAEENKNDPRLQKLAREFLCDVGSVLWELHFGRHWDEAWTPAECAVAGK